MQNTLANERSVRHAIISCEEARRIGVEHKQLKGFNLATKEEFWIDEEKQSSIREAGSSGGGDEGPSGGADREGDVSEDRGQSQATGKQRVTSTLLKRMRTRRTG